MIIEELSNKSKIGTEKAEKPVEEVAAAEETTEVAEEETQGKAKKRGRFGRK